MDIKEVTKRFHKVKADLKEKFKAKGMTEDQIQIKLNSIDNDFLTGIWVNGKYLKEGKTNADRLDFYVRFLELELKNE